MTVSGTRGTSGVHLAGEHRADGNIAYMKVKKIPLTRVAASTEQDTNIDLPARALVMDAFIDCTTAEATGVTKTIEVGLLSSESGGDADGFLDAVSVSTTGMKRGSLANGAVTLGALLRTVDQADRGNMICHLGHFNLAGVADGDLVTAFTPGFAGTISKFYAVTTVAATTASKASTLNLEIGTTNLTGGSLALTTVTCDTVGKVVAASAITAANTFTSSDTISVEAASTTTFIEGEIDLYMVVKDTNATVYVPSPHPVATAKSITYTLGSDDWAEFVGDLYVVYCEPIVK